MTDALGIWVVLILLFLALSISTGKTFLQASNLINLVRQICVTCLVAVGATFVVCGGEIDLSSGEMAALAGCFSAMLMVRYGWNTWTSILVVLAVGTLFGILTGLVVTILNVPSFIATLGMMYVLEGIVLLLTRGTPINGLHEGLYRDWPRLCWPDPDSGDHCRGDYPRWRVCFQVYEIRAQHSGGR